MSHVHVALAMPSKRTAGTDNQNVGANPAPATIEIAPLSGSACSIEASGPVTFSQPDFATARCV